MVEFKYIFVEVSLEYFSFEMYDVRTGMFSWQQVNLVLYIKAKLLNHIIFINLFIGID